MKCLIAGIGTAVPPHSISQRDAAVLANQWCCRTPDQERLLAVLYRRTSVGNRHSVLLQRSDGMPPLRQSFYPPARDGDDRGPGTARRMRQYEAKAPALASAAGKAALEDARIDVGRVTHLVTVSCSGFHAPGVDVDLIKTLGLSPGVARTHVGFMGCHGALNALRVARSLVQSQPNACVLVCAVELCTLHQQYGWNPEQIVANALFADGAAAAVLVPGEDSSADDWLVAANGSTIIDDSADAMTWRIGNHGFEMTLSAGVPELIRRELRPWLNAWLAAHNLAIEDVGSWAVHPGGPRILGAFCEAAALERDALSDSYRVLAEYGNMSSPTVLFILQSLRLAGARRPCVALGFGPGLAVEAALLR